MIRIECPFAANVITASSATAGMRRSPIRRSMRQLMRGMTPFLRENICGRQSETWHHIHGCRMWLIVERDTMTHEIFAVRPAHPGLQQALGTVK